MTFVALRWERTKHLSPPPRNLLCFLNSHFKYKCRDLNSHFLILPHSLSDPHLECFLCDLSLTADVHDVHSSQHHRDVLLVLLTILNVNLIQISLKTV